MPLRVEERDDILRGIAARLSAREIAAALGRDPSVVSRESARGSGWDNDRVHAAHGRFEAFLARPKLCKVEAWLSVAYIVRTIGLWVRRRSGST